MIDGRIGEGVVGLFYFMAGLIVVFAPLGIWKLIDICIWIFRHFTIGFHS